MTSDEFLNFADPLPEPMLLLAGDGNILAANRAVPERLEVSLSRIIGKLLSEIVLDSPDKISHYLSLCRRSRSLVFGAMRLRTDHAAEIACRTEGCISQPKSDNSPAILMLRLMPKESAQGQFIALNQRIEELGEEIQRRRHAENELRSSEEKFRMLADTIPQLAWVARPDGEIFWYNRRWYEYTGTTLAQMEGWGWQSVHDPEILPRVLENWNRSIETGEPFEMVFPIKSAQGHFRAFLTRVNPLKDENGQIISWFGTNTDIESEKQTELQLREALRKIRDLELALDEHAIVAITDPQGNINSVNDKFCEISQYSREELIGQNHRLINSGEHSQEFFRDLWKTIAGGQVWHGEIKNRAKDGSFYWVDTTIVPFLNEQGKPRQYVAIRTDITTRKKGELASARVAAIVESSEDAIVGKDLNGIVTSWNHAAEKMFGYTAAEMIGKPISMVIPEDRKGEETSIIEKIREGKNVSHFETVRIRKDGSRIDVSIAISAIKDPTGQVVGASKVARDITEMNEVKRRMSQLNAELEERVSQRTAQLEQANTDLEAFSYSVSHDLRAPLRAVNGFAGIVLEDYSDHLPEQGKKYLERIRKGGERMGNLIDDLLAFSRLGRQHMEQRRIDTARLVAEILEEINPTYEGRKVNIRVGNLPPCQGDRALIRQVWMNLISNAVKYSRDRDPAIIEIGCDSTDKGDAYFVKDNGTGFDMKYAHKLFGVFQRFHRSDEFEGTGVGLAIVQRIAHRHRGNVWANAEKNLGAQFYFTLKQ